MISGTYFLPKRTINYTLDFLTDATRVDQESRQQLITLVETFVEERDALADEPGRREFELEFKGFRVQITERDGAFTASGITQ